MEYHAEIRIMPKKELLDPQGKTVGKNLVNVGIHGIKDVRIGKHIHVELSAESNEEAEEKIEHACKKLFANPNMETYSYRINALKNT